MKMTIEQKERVKQGCKKRDQLKIVEAQQKRHLKNKINNLIVKSILTSKDISKQKNWLKKLESLTELKTMQVLYDEISQHQTKGL